MNTQTWSESLPRVLNVPVLPFCSQNIKMIVQAVIPAPLKFSGDTAILPTLTFLPTIWMLRYLSGGVMIVISLWILRILDVWRDHSQLLVHNAWITRVRSCKYLKLRCCGVSMWSRRRVFGVGRRVMMLFYHDVSVKGKINRRVRGLSGARKMK